MEKPEENDTHLVTTSFIDSNEAHREYQFKKEIIDRMQSDTKYCVIISNFISQGAYIQAQNKIMDIIMKDSSKCKQLLYNGHDNIKNIKYRLIPGREYEFEFESELITVTIEQMSKDLPISCGMIDSIHYMFFRADKLDVLDKFILSTFTKTSKKELYSYSTNASGWKLIGKIHQRDPATLVLKTGILENILKDLDDFVSAKNDYSKYGIPYKRVYLFHGDPGTGKTSLAQIMANHVDRSLYILNFDPIMTDEDLRNAISYMDSKNGILLLEDVDCIFKSREGNQNLSSVSFSSLLNILDGAVQNTGLITIITTNHPELLDPALRRPLRIDRTIGFEKADVHQILKLFELYGVSDLKKNTIEKIGALITNNDLCPAGISGFLFRNRNAKLGDNNIIDLLKSYIDEFNIEKSNENKSRIFS